MKYFYDTEFLEDGELIELISIGIVAEDGREPPNTWSTHARSWPEAQRQHHATTQTRYT